MDDLKQRESIFSSETGKAAAVETPDADETPESLESAAAEESQAEAKEIAASLAGKEAHESSRQSRYSPVTVSSNEAGESSPVSEFLDFLKQTKRVWLIVVGAIAGTILVVTLAQRGFAWIDKSRERRQEQAIASVTPERLITRCGQPAQDATKAVFPILMRTMTYQAGADEAFVFSFSRTAEDKSDWVFLSMKDASGAKSYDTPEAKIAAMSCLNSRK